MGPDNLKDMEFHVARQIRQARLAKGMSQSLLAEKLGVTFQQLQKYESGANRITAGRLALLAMAMHLPIEQFMPQPTTTQDFETIKQLNTLTGHAKTMDLLVCFNAIENPNLRKRVIELCRTLNETAAEIG